MLVGRFGDTSGAPYLEGALSIPDLNVRDWPVSFLVDTGASRCMLGPADARNMGIPDVSTLGLREEEIHGVSGKERCFAVEAYLAFTESDSNSLHYYPVQMLISRRNADEVERLPSILGRDILNQWTMYYVGHTLQQSLTFEVGEHDGHIVIPIVNDQ